MFSVLIVSVGIMGAPNQQPVTCLGPCHDAMISCEESAPHGSLETLGARELRGTWVPMWAQGLLEAQGHGGGGPEEPIGALGARGYPLVPLVS
jgi:hypothetical protein